jgi:putative ATPase
VTAHGALPVPLHLRNPDHGMARMLGYGQGYRYPHDFPGHHVEQQYLPDALAGERLYAPSDSGHEATIAERLRRWRDRPDRDR